MVERILMVGWSFLGPLILLQLDHYLAPGSSVHVIYDPELAGRNVPREVSFDNLSVSITKGDASDHSVLDEMIGNNEFDHVIAMCYRTITPAHSDARTLMTLVQLRQVLRKRDLDGQVSIVTELLEPTDVALAQVANPDDFIISEELVSLLLAQLAENPALDALFQDLFDSGRAEMVLKPAGSYVSVNEDVPFSVAVASASDRAEIAIGYRTVGGSGGATSVVVNPPKSRSVRFGPSDQLIVLTLT